MQYKKRSSKKSKLEKWFYRILFLILILLLLLMYQHFSSAIDFLARLNTEQANMIDTLNQHVNSLELSNANLQVQNDYLKVKINGLEVNNLHNAVHNATPSVQPHIDSVDTHTHVNNESPIHKSLIDPGTITVTAMAVLTLLKNIMSPVVSLP